MPNTNPTPVDLDDERIYQLFLLGNVPLLYAEVLKARDEVRDLRAALVELAPARAAIPGPDSERIRELTDALSWALDMIDMYDERLADIDGHDRVYSSIHVAGKSAARSALAGDVQGAKRWRAEIGKVSPMTDQIPGPDTITVNREALRIVVEGGADDQEHLDRAVATLRTAMP